MNTAIKFWHKETFLPVIFLAIFFSAFIFSAQLVDAGNVCQCLDGGDEEPYLPCCPPDGGDDDDEGGVSCSWGDWSWGGCSVTCGWGEKSGSRSQTGGPSCTEIETDTMSCFAGSCPTTPPPSDPVDDPEDDPEDEPEGPSCRWGTWSRWSDCSAECGGGTQTRTRSEIGVGCTDIDYDSRSCNTHACIIYHQFTVNRIPAVGVVSGGGSYEEGADATARLTSTPPRYRFEGWTGDCIGTNSTCTTNMNRSKSTTANFTFLVLSYGLSVTRNPSAGLATTSTIFTFIPTRHSSTNTKGGVTFSDPACGGGVRAQNWNSSTGSFTCQYNSPGDKNPSVIVREEGLQFEARTAVTVNPTVTVNKGDGGNSAGTLTSNPARINCGTNCSAAFPYDSPVTLTAAPNTGDMYLFNNWDGPGCDSRENNRCSINKLRNNRTYTANFYGPFYIQPVSGGSQIGIVPGSNPPTPMTTTYVIQPQDIGNINLQACGGSDGSIVTISGNRFTCLYATAGDKLVSARVTHNGDSVTPEYENTIKYASPTITEFKPNPDWIRRETDGVDESGTSELVWTVYNATSCNITGSDGFSRSYPGLSNPASESAKVTGVNSTTIYTLTCTGLGSAPNGGFTTTATTRLNVLPVYQEF